MTGAPNFIQGAMRNALSVQANPAAHMNNSQKAFAGSGDLALKLTTLIDNEEQMRLDQLNADRNHLLDLAKQTETGRHNLVTEANTAARTGVMERRLNMDSKANNRLAYKDVYDMKKTELANMPMYDDSGALRPEYTQAATELKVLGNQVTQGLTEDYKLKMSESPIQGAALPDSLQLDTPGGTTNKSTGRTDSVMAPNLLGTNVEPDDIRTNPNSDIPGEQVDFLLGNRTGVEAEFVPKTDQDIRDRLIDGQKKWKVSKDGRSRELKIPTGEDKSNIALVKEMFNIPDGQYVNSTDAKEAIEYYAENDPKKLYDLPVDLSKAVKKRAVLGFTRKALQSEEGFQELADAIAQGRLTTTNVHEAITDNPSLNNTKDLITRLNGSVDQKKLILNSKGSTGEPILPEELALKIDEAATNRPTGITGMYGPTGGEIAKEALTNEGMIEGALSYLGEALGIGSQDINPKVFKNIAARNRQQFGKDFTVDGINNMQDIVTGESWGVTTIDNELILESFEDLGIKIDEDKIMRLAEYGEYREAKARDHGVTNPMYRESKWNRIVKDYEKKYPDAESTGVNKIMKDSIKGSMEDIKTQIASRDNLTPAMKNVASYLMLMELQAEKEAGNIQSTASEKTQSKISEFSTGLADFIFN